MPQFVFDTDAGVSKQAPRSGSSIDSPNFECRDLRRCGTPEYYSISGSTNLNIPGDNCGPSAPYVRLSIRDLLRYEPIGDSTFVPYTLAAAGGRGYRLMESALYIYVLQAVLSIMDTPANYPLGNPLDFDPTGGGNYVFGQKAWTWKNTEFERRIGIPILKPVLDNCGNQIGYAGRASVAESYFDTFCQGTLTRSISLGIAVNNRLNVYNDAFGALTVLHNYGWPNVPDTTACANLPQTAFTQWRTDTTLPFTLTVTETPAAP